MNKWIRRAAIATLGLAGAAVATLVIGAQAGQRKAQRQLSVAAHPITLRNDAQAIERGRYLYGSRGCADCHGTDGAGRDVIDAGKGGLFVHAPNITPGRGGAVAGYAPQNWDATIRHGVKPDGRPLLIMPSEDYNRLTDEDLESVVAYVRQLAPVEAPGATLRLPMPVQALYAVGVVRDAAEKIDHRLPVATPVPEGVTREHGAYVANSCIGCHGQGLAGGRIPGAPPDWPAAANLTPGEGSVLPRYPDADAFIAMLRSGRRPDGSAVSPVMPFGALAQLSDVDAKALYLQLNSLPARPAGQR